ncbi:MAG: molybdenum cofactor biosynthesis protein MoaE [Candidatus Omnitrophica bacterium]|nr:molybdenum cofactor biosynthesis protein MoaE [Candidatus Omnitrophota bacterium]
MNYITDQPVSRAGLEMGKANESSGAKVTFVGYVRNHNDGKIVDKLYYECYPSMAEKQIQNIINRAKAIWNIKNVRVLHRVGWLRIGDIAVFVSVEAEHRDGAFLACRWVIDTIKQDVPIWKKEFYSDHPEGWVSASSVKEVPACG